MIMSVNMVGTNNFAVCNRCYDGKIVCQRIDDMTVFFCESCLEEVTFKEYKTETFK